ncbi:MAG: YlmC/YmxH family sporulation protein [Ruminococcus sp.]|jgi:YlmC/YmxH family sporulation protein|nr:YlmC/YmxH family sporulation protein [Ruminococcus sp.]
MVFTLAELRGKEVINITDGSKMGYIDDVEFDTIGGGLSSIIIFGNAKFMGIFGREDNIVIPFSDIELIGVDTILVKIHSSVHLPEYIKNSEINLTKDNIFY